MTEIPSTTKKCSNCFHAEKEPLCYNCEGVDGVTEITSDFVCGNWEERKVKTFKVTSLKTGESFLIFGSGCDEINPKLWEEAKKRGLKNPDFWSEEVK